jgi:hypothetical protein
MVLSFFERLYSISVQEACRVKEAWRLAPLCLLWCIWWERNARLFEDVETSMVKLRKRLLNMLYIWIASHHYLNNFTYVNFLNLFSSSPI